MLQASSIKVVFGDELVCIRLNGLKRIRLTREKNCVRCLILRGASNSFLEFHEYWIWWRELIRLKEQEPLFQISLESSVSKRCPAWRKTNGNGPTKWINIPKSSLAIKWK